MEVHHLIAEHHSALVKTKCLQCNESINSEKWSSTHHLEFHYKTLICGKCGYQNLLKVDFHGSGHDNWHKKGTIEEKLKIVEVKKI